MAPKSQDRSPDVPLRITGWSDAVDEILDGEHAVMLAYVTPARGVVLTPLSNFGLHDRSNGVVTVNSSIGAWKKLERIRRNPSVALAFHTRAHAAHRHPEYVLVQGRAALGPPIDDYPSSVLANWERLEPWRDLGKLWKRWMRVYARRVEIRIAVERIVVWPDLACRGRPQVLGTPLPDKPPPSQDPPARGTAPRINPKRAANRARRLPDVLLGWVGTDGLPFVVPVKIGAADQRGIALDAPEGTLPPGGRRAGLTAHWFSRGVVGQRQRVHTGWLEVGPDAPTAIYAPHTKAAYRMPPSRLIYRTAAGLVTRLRYRQARRAGVSLPEQPRR